MSILHQGTWFHEAADLVGKPEMRDTPQGVNDWGKDKSRLPKKTLGIKGKGWLYPESCLPEATREYFLEQRTRECLIRAEPAALLASPATIEKAVSRLKKPVALGAFTGSSRSFANKKVVPASQTTDKEDRHAEAQAELAQAILQLDAEGLSRKRAAKALLEALAKGEVKESLWVAARDANPKPRKGKLPVSLSSLLRYAERYEAGTCEGDCLKFLRVAQREPVAYTDIPWLPYFLARYRVPSRPTVAEARRAMVVDLKAIGWSDREIPSEDAVYRIVNRLPVTVQERGRATGAAWKALRPCIRRDWSGLSPMQVWVGDGHTFKAKVQHPDHGRPFAPEVTLVLDAAPRLVVGWAVSLSENCLAVSEALSHGFKQYGKPLVYYSDNGAGQTATMLDAPVTGLLARMGIDHQTGIPGNPQGRGIVERVWRTLLIPLARTFPTCQTQTMDRETLNKRTREIQSAQKKGEVPAFVPTWNQFIDALEAAIHDYNTEHRHSELNGSTPLAFFNANPPEMGCIPLTSEEMLGLYRPEVIRTPMRGEISLFNNRYYLSDLAELNPGTQVRVAFDVHDAKTVWVKDLKGRMLGEAVWNGNLRDAFPKPYIDALKEKRVDEMVKRRQAQIDTARAELGATIEAGSGVTLTIADFVSSAETEEREPKRSYADTVMWLYGTEADEGQDDKKAAVG
jgi:putative transposase